MITVIARLKVKPGGEAEFQEAARDVITHVKKNEAGTLKYVLYHATADPTQFVFFEAYADQAALAAHSSSAAMQAFVARIGSLLDGRPEIGTFEELGGK